MGRPGVVALVFVGLVLMAVGCRKEAATALETPVVVTATQPAQAWGCLYEADGGAFWLSTTPGSVPVKLLSMQPDEYVNECAVSADGRQVAVTTDQGKGQLVAAAGGQAETLFTDATDAGGLAWSPDGSRLAYGADGILYLQEPGQPRVKLATAPRVTDLAWSPDGLRIAYGRRADDDKDLGLWLVPAGGGTPRRIVKSSGDVFGVSEISWSPDGKWIAFLHAWEGGALCFVRPDGSSYRKDVGPAWGDVQWLGSSEVVYVSMEDEMTTRGIFRCTPAGKPQQIIDGKAVTFALSRAGSLLVLKNPPDENAEKVIDASIIANAGAGLSTTWARKMSGNYATGSWSPDGQTIAVCVEDEAGKGTLYLAPVRGELSERATAMRRILGWAQGVEQPQAGKAALPAD
ncbi:MAG: hypothetical protein ABFE08_10725 [Armatimonadia bacterium]